MDILIADDDLPSVTLTSFLLESAGYRVFKAYDGQAVLQAVKQHPPDLLLLDVSMPKINGFEVCRQIRYTSDMPIIFLSARSHLKDRVKGLQMGADDYLVKPVEPAELLARVEAVLRRCSSGPSNVSVSIRQGDMTLDPIERRVMFADGRTIDLTPIEFRLLYYLMKNAGHTLNASQILLQVWGYDFEGESNSLASYILRLRKKIEPNPERPTHLITVHKLGYKFEAQQDTTTCPSG